jgi:dTDP-4-dehydrorhamnose reductase
MRVLVTGAQGQLARSIVERAAAHPQSEIIALGRPQLDLEVAGSGEQAIGAVRPDVVINAAAYTAVDQAEDEPERAQRINAEAAREVAAAAATIGARVIQISTDYVFDGRADGAYAEDAAPNPLGVYGRTKLAGEEEVRAANPEHFILRTAWVYSPFGRNFVKTMMDAAQSRETLGVVDDQRGSPSSALDLADGLFRILEIWGQGSEAGLGETYHLAGTGSASWCGFARAIMAECRKRGLPAAEIRPIATADWPTKAVRPANSVMSSARFERDFGFSMPRWEESLSKVIERLTGDVRGGRLAG